MDINDDPFRAGFEAGFRRGVRFGMLNVADRVRGALPTDTQYLGHMAASVTDGELTRELLDREHRHRRRPMVQPMQGMSPDQCDSKDVEDRRVRDRRSG